MQHTIVFIDNFDSFTYNLVSEFKTLGKEVLVYRNDVDVDFINKLIEELRLKKHKVTLVLSPGPSTPQLANNLIPIIESNLGKTPMLGICLGHQALGFVLGGKVINAPQIVHGKVSYIEHQAKACFENLPSPLRVARYHSLIVTNLPENVEILASYEGMCMALYEKNLKILGLQFHPESIMTTYGREILKKALDAI